MWKYGKRILMTIFLLALVLSFCSCSNKEEEEGEEKEEKVVVNYADINEITILNADDLEQTGFLLDEFNLSEIKLHITYLSSEETVDVPVTENMVRAEDKAKLSVAGTHSITLYYGKFTIEFKLRLFRTLENVHRVTFMDWEGNRLGDVQYLKEGQIATVPNLESRQGFQFLGWQNSETGEIVTSFVFLQDVTLVASYAPEYYSVDYYYRIGDDEVYLSSEWVKRGADAYDYAPAIPIVEGYSNGHWSDTPAMKNVDRDGLKFYAVFDKDYVNATFVYYKFVEGEWYSYDVYWKVSEASEGISAPDDVRRVSSDIFLYWYIKHGNAEVRVDFPYVLTAETTFYAKYIPAEQGSSGIEVRYVDAENGSVDKEGYYIVAYDGDDDIIAVPTSISFASDKRYMFVRRSVTVGSMIRNKYYNRADGYLYKSEDEYAQDKEYYERICVGYENDTYFVYMPQTVVPGEYVQPNTYYDIVDGEYHLTEENYFLADKNYYIKKNAVIRSGEFYLEESIPVGTELEADTYYYFRDNTFILLTERTQARIRYVYYTKITGLTINGTSLFAEENRMLNAKASVCCVPQNKTMLLGLMGHPFASNGAKRFFVANDNTVFRVNNDSLYSVDLKTLYAYPTGRTAETYKVETKRLTIENIADYAFYGAKLLRSVTLPDTILNIGEYAFAECAALTSFTVPASVEHIGRYAFYDDISVTEYNFDEGSALVTIGEFCFAKNHLLGSFALPSSVQSIGKGLFAECVSLESISADSEYFTVDRANGGLYGQKDAMSYYYLYAFPAKFPGSSNGVININSGARVVCTGAFSYTSLYEIAFESRNNSIIFESGSVVCPTLRTVRLNCTVLTVHDNMFDDPLSSYSFWPECFYLDHDTASALGGFLNDSAFRSVERREYSDIIGRAENKPYSEDFGYVMVSHAGVQTVTITGYRGTTTELVIPDNINNAEVTAIDDNAFRECKTVRTLSIPDSVESIGDYAFYGCDNLRSISFGVGIKSIGTRAFSDCGSLI